MNTLPDNIKSLIFEYDNTYRDTFDNVIVEMNSNRRGLATYALEPLVDDLCVRRKCYSFKNIKTHRTHKYHTSLTYSYDTTPTEYPY